jgi:hypothetical protein
MEFDVTSVSAIVAAVGVLVGVVLTVLELRNLVKQRQTDLFMKVYSIFGSGKFSKAVRRLLATEVKNYDDFVRKHGSVVSIEPEPAQIWLDIDLIGWFFNEMGFLVNEKLVSEKLVCKLLGYWVIILWEKMRPLIYGWRKEYNMSESFSWFEYLYNEMKRREQ